MLTVKLHTEPGQNHFRFQVSNIRLSFLSAGSLADKLGRRLIGRKFADKDVQSDIKHFPFRVTNQNDKPAITVEVQGKDRSFSPEEVSAMVLGKMKVCIFLARYFS